jgi:hypothetical protein
LLAFRRQAQAFGHGGYQLDFLSAGFAACLIKRLCLFPKNALSAAQTCLQHRGKG